MCRGLTTPFIDFKFFVVEQEFSAALTASLTHLAESTQVDSSGQYQVVREFMVPLRGRSRAQKGTVL